MAPIPSWLKSQCCRSVTCSTFLQWPPTAFGRDAITMRGSVAARVTGWLRSSVAVTAGPDGCEWCPFRRMPGNSAYGTTSAAQLAVPFGASSRQRGSRPHSRKPGGGRTRLQLTEHGDGDQARTAVAGHGRQCPCSAIRVLMRAVSDCSDHERDAHQAELFGF